MFLSKFSVWDSRKYVYYILPTIRNLGLKYKSQAGSFFLHEELDGKYFRIVHYMVFDEITQLCCISLKAGVSGI